VASDLKPVPRVAEGARCWFPIRHDRAPTGVSVRVLGVGLGVHRSQVPCPAREREQGEFLRALGGIGFAGCSGVVAGIYQAHRGLVLIDLGALFTSMTYVTIEAEIADGRIVPKESGQLPDRGRALVTLLPDTPRQPNWEAVEATFGSLRRPNVDNSAWQRGVRAEWDRD